MRVGGRWSDSIGRTVDVRRRGRRDALRLHSELEEDWIVKIAKVSRPPMSGQLNGNMDDNRISCEKFPGPILEVRPSLRRSILLKPSLLAAAAKVHPMAELLGKELQRYFSEKRDGDRVRVPKPSISDVAVQLPSLFSILSFLEYETRRGYTFRIGGCKSRVSERMARNRRGKWASNQ